MNSKRAKWVKVENGIVHKSNEIDVLIYNVRRALPRFISNAVFENIKETIEDLGYFKDINSFNQIKGSMKGISEDINTLDFFMEYYKKNDSLQGYLLKSLPLFIEKDKIKKLKDYEELFLKKFYNVNDKGSKYKLMDKYIKENNEYIIEIEKIAKIIKDDIDNPDTADIKILKEVTELSYKTQKLSHVVKFISTEADEISKNVKKLEDSEHLEKYHVLEFVTALLDKVTALKEKLSPSDCASDQFKMSQYINENDELKILSCLKDETEYQQYKIDDNTRTILSEVLDKVVTNYNKKMLLVLLPGLDNRSIKILSEIIEGLDDYTQKEIKNLLSENEPEKILNEIKTFNQPNTPLEIFKKADSYSKIKLVEIINTFKEDIEKNPKNTITKLNQILDVKSKIIFPLYYYCNMDTSSDHYYFYKKDHEHIPGVMSIEVARQAGYAYFYPYKEGFDKGEITISLSKMNMEFFDYAQSNYPIRVMVEDISEHTELGTLRTKRVERLGMRMTMFQRQKVINIFDNYGVAIDLKIFDEIRTDELGTFRFVPIKKIGKYITLEAINNPDSNDEHIEIKGCLENISIGGFKINHSTTILNKNGYESLKNTNKPENIKNNYFKFIICADNETITGYCHIRWIKNNIDSTSGRKYNIGFQIDKMSPENIHRLKEAIKKYTYIIEERVVY